MSVDLSKIKELKAKIKKLREEANKEIKGIFKEAILELFVEYPNLKRISWTQYTPYFNDGDTCEFGSNHTSPALYFTSPIPGEDEVEDEDEYDRYEEEWSEYPYTEYDSNYKKKGLKKDLTAEQKEQLKTGKAVIEFLSNFDDDDMYGLFGDHQKVIVTAKKIEAEDYEHD